MPALPAVHPCLVGSRQSLVRMLPRRGRRGGRPEAEAAAAGRRRPEHGPFHRTRGRAGADGLTPAPGCGRGVDVAGSADSRPDSRRARLALPEDVQPLRRGRGSARSLPRLRTLPGGAAASRGLPALRGSAPHGCRGGGGARRFGARAVSRVPRTTSSLRPGGRTVELRTSAQQPHPSHEVSPGALGRGRPRAPPRARGGVPPRLCDARRGDRTAHLPTAAPPARIQPRGRAGRHRPAGAGSPAAAEGPHRQAPHAASGEGGKRGGAP